MYGWCRMPLGPSVEDLESAIAMVGESPGGGPVSGIWTGIAL